MRVSVLAMGILCACATGVPGVVGRQGKAPFEPPAERAAALLGRALRPWPAEGSNGLLAVTDSATGRLATYDSALVVLVLLRAGRRDVAARVLGGLSALQQEDGGLPFSFVLPGPDPAVRYERSGAIAWVGYAASEYLDAERGGPARDVALGVAHRTARYLLARQVARRGDPRDGLVLGGTGTLRYEIDGDSVRELLEPGDVAWASVEHNVDAYFFLRALWRVTGTRAYAEAAARIGEALEARAWLTDGGQLAAGVGPEGPDGTMALDCASWGSVMLGAVGATARAQTAMALADGRYATRDGRSGARGHRPYASGPLLDDPALMRHFAATLPAATWDEAEVVWPEGSAGVALAAWRAGHVARAREILDGLEPLRAADGWLPTATLAVPFLFDTRPSIAATAWVALLRFELDRHVGSPTLWPP